jgi:hypothetical protein
VEPQQQPRSTPPPPPGTPPPPPPAAASGSGKTPAPPSAPAGEPDGAVTICPACGEPRAEDARYCEECGHDYGGRTAPEAEERTFLSGPALWIFMLFWVALAIACLWYLFSVLWAA